jgi:hypothetical protein
MSVNSVKISIKHNNVESHKLQIFSHHVDQNTKYSLKEERFIFTDSLESVIHGGKARWDNSHHDRQETDSGRKKGSKDKRTPRICHSNLFLPVWPRLLKVPEHLKIAPPAGKQVFNT